MTEAVSKIELGVFETVPIDQVRPYWRNPRRVTEEAVNQLAESIRSYGYQQPIVVDSDYVIIVGHTRYAAMRRMDVTQVPVMVATTLTPEQVKQYRLIDNKVSELTSWDYESLIAELGEMDTALIMALFPEAGGPPDPNAPGDDEAVLAREWDHVVTQVGFVCPECYHSFEVNVTREALLTGVIEAGGQQ